MIIKSLCRLGKSLWDARIALKKPDEGSQYVAQREIRRLLDERERERFYELEAEHNRLRAEKDLKFVLSLHGKS